MAAPQVQRFAQFIRRLFSLKERYDQGILEDLMPTLEVVNPIDPSAHHLRGENLLNVGVTGVAAAGLFTEVVIQAVFPSPIVGAQFNRQLNTNLVVIDQLELVNPGVAMGFRAVAVNSAFSAAPAAAAWAVDGRAFFIPGEGGIRRNLGATPGQNAVQRGDPGIIKRWFLPAGSSLVVPVRWALWGPLIIVVQAETLNQAFQLNLSGWERVAEPSEAF